MFSKKEVFSIVSVSLVLGLVLSLSAKDLSAWQKLILPAIGIVFLVILINVFSKKVVAYFFDAKVEVSTWEWKRYGYKPHQRLKSSFPFGFFIPLILKFLTVGLINWMAALTFEVKGTIYRAAKKWQMYQYIEVTEEEMAWIAFAGIFMNLVFAILGYLINAPLFSKVNLLYAFYNTIPLSNLDGTKIFFGKKHLWWFTAIVTTLALVGSLIIV